MQRAEGHHFRLDAWKCSNKPLQLLTYRNEAKRDHPRMKLYQLVGWPDLGAPFHRMAYRRMLHQMSQRPMSLRQLARHSGLERSAVQRFIDTLAERELLTEREPVALSFFGRCRSLLSAARHS